jgi:hypothetical protein
LVGELSEGGSVGRCVRVCGEPDGEVGFPFPESFEPVAVAAELRKPQPDGRVIEKLMKRFVYTAGITGVMQVAALVIMTRLVS